MAKARIKVDRDGNEGAGWYIPNVVSNSAAWRAMSLPEFRLITIAASLFSPKDANNGYLALSFEYLKKHYGWASEGSLVKARQALCEKGLLLLTRQGERTNIPGLYALTWLPIRDRAEGPRLDVAAYDYARSHRGAYVRWLPSEAKLLRGKARLVAEKRPTISARRSAKQDNSSARRSTDQTRIGVVTPPSGAIKGKTDQFRTPPGGYNLGNTTSKGVQ